MLGGRLVVSGVIYWSRCMESSIVAYSVCILLILRDQPVTRASVGEWGLSRTKVCSGAVGVLRVAISGSRQGIGRGRDLR